MISVQTKYYVVELCKNLKTILELQYSCIMFSYFGLIHLLILTGNAKR